MSKLKPSFDFDPITILVEDQNKKKIPISFSNATRKERQEVYRLRYKVLVETDRYYSGDGTGRILEKYDKLKETIIIIAKHNGKIVGTVRLVLTNLMGFPTEEYYNVSSAFDGTKVLGDLSRIALLKEYRSFGLAQMLMCIGHDVGKSLGVDTFVGVANPKAMNLFANLGWYKTGQELFSQKFGVPFIPIAADRESALVISDLKYQEIHVTRPVSQPRSQQPISISQIDLST